MPLPAFKIDQPRVDQIVNLLYGPREYPLLVGLYDEEQKHVKVYCRYCLNWHTHSRSTHYVSEKACPCKPSSLYRLTGYGIHLISQYKSYFNWIMLNGLSIPIHKLSKYAELSVQTMQAILRQNRIKVYNQLYCDDPALHTTSNSLAERKPANGKIEGHTHDSLDLVRVVSLSWIELGIVEYLSKENIKKVNQLGSVASNQPKASKSDA